MLKQLLQALIDRIKPCQHSWISDKNKPFAYCDKCMCCIKDGKTMSAKEYKSKIIKS